MSEDQNELVDRRGMLDLLPPFIKWAILDDSSFCETIGVKTDASLSFGTGTAEFRASVFFEAVQDAYGEAPKVCRVRAENGEGWDLSVDLEVKPSVIEISNGDQRHKSWNFFGLNPNKSRRLLDFTTVLSNVGLAPTALPHWRACLTSGPIVGSEIHSLQKELSETPISLVEALEDQLINSTCKIETLAPTERQYYEHFCGSGNAETIEQFAEQCVPGFVAERLSWDQHQGARMSLLLASHSSIVPASGLCELPVAEIEALANWAVDHGDLISKLGMIELGLITLDRAPQLETKICKLIEQIAELDPRDPNGRLHFLTAMLMLVYGDLSRSKALDGWPPFRKRIAALAQASLIERHMFGRFNTEDFGHWAMETRGQNFYFQMLVDMRLEPRWLPEMGGPDQLRHEFIGRITNAAGRFQSNIKDGPLRLLLFDDPSSAFAGQVQAPNCFLPGPIEGAEQTSPAPIAREIEELIGKAFAADKLERSSIIPLINLRWFLTSRDDRIERLTELIKAARHRLSDEFDIETRDAVIYGFASLASLVRDPKLSDELRIMMRKIRVENVSPPDPRQELATALIAGAAHRDMDAWISFVGDWGLELAFSTNSKEAILPLAETLKTLCSIEPALRTKLGRAIAASEAFCGA